MVVLVEVVDVEVDVVLGAIVEVVVLVEDVEVVINPTGPKVFE